MNEATMTGLYVFILLNLLDYMTTRAGIIQGAHEKNPLASYILKKYGFMGLYAFKFILTGLIPFIVYLQRNDISKTIWIWNIIFSIVVGINSYTNARLAGKKNHL